MGPWHLRLDNQQVMEARAAWPVRASSTQPPWCVSAPTPCARYNRSHLDNRRHPRRWTVIFSGLLCGVLALVVIYTNRGGLSSPLAIVVLAAIGLLALILQLRLREPRPIRAPLWLNLLGILFALAALGSDLTHIRADLAPVLALLAVACFAISSATVLQALRREPPGADSSEQNSP